MVREIDDKLAISEALLVWQHHNAGQVIVQVRLLLLAKVADHVVAVRFALAKNVKVKGVNLKRNVLVVEEELGYVTQILRVNFLLLRIKLEN